MTVGEYNTIHNVIKKGKHRYRIFAKEVAKYGVYLYAYGEQDLEEKWMNYCIENGFGSNAIVEKIIVDDV